MGLKNTKEQKQRAFLYLPRPRERHLVLAEEQNGDRDGGKEFVFFKGGERFMIVLLSIDWELLSCDTGDR